MSDGIGKNSLNDISKIYLDKVASQETTEEGYKEIDRSKENRMYRRAGNLARTGLAAKGKKKEDALNKSNKIVSAISRQKEKERFAKMGDEKARDNYKEGLGEAKEDDVRDSKMVKAGISKDTRDRVKKEIRSARANPNYGKTKLESLDPVGQEDGDINNDGKKDKTDKYLMNRRKKIGKAIAANEAVDKRDEAAMKKFQELQKNVDQKKKLKKEEFSDWRADLQEQGLIEVMDETEADKPIKEKKVNNKVKINPKLGEIAILTGGTVISEEEVEIDEKINPLLKGILKKTPKGEDPKKGGVPYKRTGKMTEGLSVDDQMRISRDYNRMSPEEKRAANKKVLGTIKKVKREKDTRTDAQKMTDATGPRPGSRYRGD